MTEPHNKEAEALLAGTVDALPAGALEAQLDLGRPLRVKFGIDPTAPDIHLGHVVVLRKLREFQDLGHTVVLIIGDYTARVGDPSGRSATRPVLSPEQIDANAETFKRQAFTVLDGECTEIRRNSEWLDMSMQDLFALTRGSTVAQLLERDDFAKRFADRRPISILELLYPLLQGYDSHAVAADVELGGTDQKFNLLHARAVQQQYGSAQQSMLTMPILPGIDGVERMSKSLGNYVAVTDRPDQLFGKLMRIPDQVMPTYYELLLGRIPDPAAPPVMAKRALAGELTDRFHGAGAGAAAERAFDTLHVDHGIPDEVQEDALPDGETIHLPELLAGSFGISRSEARRLLAGGGVKLDGAALGRDDLDLDRAQLEGAVLQIGRRRHRRYV